MARAVRTYLEMTDPGVLDGAPSPSAEAVVTREDEAPPSLWRFLYTEVGREYHWVDRLTWADEEIRAYLADPALELWVLRVAGEPAGYFELRTQADGSVEVAYFGLLPAFVGRYQDRS